MGATTLPAPSTAPRLIPLRARSDERLAAAVARGDTDAFGTLYQRYREPLSRYCRSIVRDPEDTRDALQNTMVSVLRALRHSAPTGRLRPWLYRIAHNESVSLLRRRRPDVELTEQTPEPASESPDGTVRERLAQVLDDLRTLPERQRGALVMRELAGLDYDDIGVALELSPPAARKAVHEARLSLTELEAGRKTGCLEITRQISDGDRRALRARRVRAHLRSCAGCSAFEASVRQRRSALALVPAVPSASIGALLGGALPAAGGAAGSIAGAGGAAGSVAGAGGAAGSVAGGASLLTGGGAAALKCVAVCGALAVAGAGAVVSHQMSARAGHRGHTHAVPRHIASASAARGERVQPPHHHTRTRTRTHGGTGDAAPRPHHAAAPHAVAPPAHAGAGRAARHVAVPSVIGPVVSNPGGGSATSSMTPPTAASQTLAPAATHGAPTRAAPTPTTATPATPQARPQDPSLALASTIAGRAVQPAATAAATITQSVQQALAAAQQQTGSPISQLQTLISTLSGGFHK